MHLQYHFPNESFTFSHAGRARGFIFHMRFFKSRDSLNSKDSCSHVGGVIVLFCTGLSKIIHLFRKDNLSYVA